MFSKTNLQKGASFYNNSKLFLIKNKNLLLKNIDTD